MSIREGDGTAIEAIREGDGTAIVEVRTGAGVVVWSASDSGPPSYTGTFFGIGSETLNPNGLTFGDSSFWLLGDGTVFEYDADGNYENDSFSVSGQVDRERGLTWNGSTLWASGDFDVYEYATDGTYQNNSFDVSGELSSQIEGLTWYDNSFWVLEKGATVYEYAADGTYQNNSFAATDELDEAYGLTRGGSSFWVAGYVLGPQGGTQAIEAHAYADDGSYLNTSFDPSSEDNSPRGMAYENGSIWIAGSENTAVYEYA